MPPHLTQNRIALLATQAKWAARRCRQCRSSHHHFCRPDPAPTASLTESSSQPEAPHKRRSSLLKSFSTLTIKNRCDRQCVYISIQLDLTTLGLKIQATVAIAIPRASLDPRRGDWVFDLRSAASAQTTRGHSRDHDFLRQPLRCLLFPSSRIWSLLAARLSRHRALVNGSRHIIPNHLDCRGAAAGPS